MWGDFDEDQLANISVWTGLRVLLILRIKHLEHIGWGLVVKCGVANRNRISIPVTLGSHLIETQQFFEMFLTSVTLHSNRTACVATNQIGT